MKKNFQDIVGTVIGWVTGWISSGFYETWIQPMILAAVCAFIGLLVTHYGRKVLHSLENRKLPKFPQNGRDK